MIPFYLYFYGACLVLAAVLVLIAVFAAMFHKKMPRTVGYIVYYGYKAFMTMYIIVLLIMFLCGGEK